MGLLRAIAIILFLGWAVGFAFMRELGWFVHVPLVLALLTLAALTFRPRPREKSTPRG